jgi:hypothetical protein
MGVTRMAANDSLGEMADHTVAPALVVVVVAGRSQGRRRTP